MPLQSEPVFISTDNLQNLGDVTVPKYDRNALAQSIVHIGVGGFHRAHLATYIHELCANGHTAWGIVGSGVLPGDAAMAETLAAQDGLYTLVVRGPEKTTVEIIGSLVDYIHAAADPAQLVERIADPATQIVSLTVTEGGYPIDDVTGEYAPDSPNAGALGAFGMIAAGLDLRRTNDAGPLTILSCDNIMSNGAASKAATLGEAAHLGEELVAWINQEVSFPNSMVDRITPATTDSDRSWLAAEVGIGDRWPVVTEPFRQWIVEDAFAGARPPLEELDIIVTSDVEPYEHMKLRLLNAGHSCLAYLAALLGIDTVDAAMADHNIARYVRAFLDREARPVVPTVAGIDVDVYIDTLIERFSNPNIGDQISRLCLDGSAKFPKFLLPTVRAQLAQDGPIALSALALAGWCAYLRGTTSAGAPITLAADPSLSRAREHAEASVEDPSEFLRFTEVFDSEIADHPRFVAAFSDALTSLTESGVPAAIDAALNADHPS